MDLTLTRKQHLAGNAWLFTFTPERPLSWMAGQFIRVELPHKHPDAEGTKRQFTIASAPADGVVQIATRLTGSTFKRALNALPPGATIRMVDPPAGDFVWPPDGSLPLLFLAQGIGITPFRSLLRQRCRLGLPLSARLLHANLAPGVPFQDEIEEWTADPQFTVTFLNQAITPALLSHLVPNLRGALVYASGPLQLTRLMLQPVNLPTSQLKQDQFPNYAASDY
jgi:ferredoxin-NADP reductase